MALSQPLNEHDAPENVHTLYQDIKATLSIPYVPMMFRYLGNYPVFLERLWPTLRANLQDPAFMRLQRTLQADALRAVRPFVQDHDELREVAHRIIPPQQESLIAEEISKYFTMQLQFAFMAIAIRERTKGWAIGGKLLPDLQAAEAANPYEERTHFHQELHEMVIAETSTALAQCDDIREALITYVVYIHEEFVSIITKDEYVFTRVQFEKILNHHIHNIPHPLFASYNEVVKSIPDKKELAGIFYLLSEKFPVSQTIAALMWGMGVEVLNEP